MKPTTLFAIAIWASGFIIGAIVPSTWPKYSGNAILAAIAVAAFFFKKITVTGLIVLLLLQAVGLVLAGLSDALTPTPSDGSGSTGSTGSDGN